MEEITTSSLSREFIKHCRNTPCSTCEYRGKEENVKITQCILNFANKNIERYSNEYIICSCGSRVLGSEASICMVTKKIICPECSAYCPNCGALVKKSQISSTGTCKLCEK